MASSAASPSAHGRTTSGVSLADLSQPTLDLKALEANLRHYAENPQLVRDLAGDASLSAALNPQVLSLPNYRIEDGRQGPVASVSIVMGASSGATTPGGAVPPVLLPTSPVPGTPAAPADRQGTEPSGLSLLLQETDLERQIVIENSDRDTSWYFNSFMGSPHRVYLGLDDGKDDKRGYYALATLLESGDSGGFLRAILWRKEGVERIQVPIEKKADVAKLDLLKLFDPSCASFFFGLPRQSPLLFRSCLPPRLDSRNGPSRAR